MNFHTVTSLLAFWVTCSRAATNQSLVYSWVSVDYDWPNDTMKQDYVRTKKYIVENNVIVGIKVYRDDVFLTVPRARPGVPSTLNRVITKGGEWLLQPYPSWEAQREGECQVLQFVQSMEVDPNTGLMWIIDNGRLHIATHTPVNLCPPKLVIYDMVKRREVHRYIFPSHVANHSSCFLNDIVLDYVNGDVKFAYVTDSSDAKLYVYDVERDTSYFFQHDSMKTSSPGGRYPINGIAMSSDFRYVYYCPIDGLGLFQIPTSVLRQEGAPFSRHVRQVGRRRGKSGSLTYGETSLFYTLLFKNGLQRWRVAEDAQISGYDHVTLTSEEAVAHDDVRMRWVDTLAWDDSGHLWFTANDLSRFLNQSMDFSGASGANMYVWRVCVGEQSYLSHARNGTDSIRDLVRDDHTSSPASSGWTRLRLRDVLVCVLLLLLVAD